MSSLRGRVLRAGMARATGLLGRAKTVREAQAWASRGTRRPRLPRGVRLEWADAGGVRCAWLHPRGEARGTLLYLHGGAWTLGWSALHFGLVARLVRQSQWRALMVDYRLAPDFPYPAALEDCLTAYRWLVDEGTPEGGIVIAGDSAGGHLTLTSLLALHGQRPWDGAGTAPIWAKLDGLAPPAAGICLSPVTDLTGSAPRSQGPVADAGLPLHTVALDPRHYIGNHDPADPLISPVLGNLSSLPPLLIQAGGDEWLREDAECFAGRALAAGADVTLQVFPGMWHVFQLLAPWLPEANRALESMAGFLGRVGQGRR